MEIKVGGRYRCIGRNMDRFECEVERIDCSNSIPVIHLKNSNWNYNERFFKENFEPIEVEKEKYLKPMEAAKKILAGETLITRDGHTCKWDGDGVQMGDGYKYLLTGLSEQKKVLEVDQVWESESSRHRKILFIDRGDLVYRQENSTSLQITTIEYFLKYYAHKLLTTKEK